MKSQNRSWILFALLMILWPTIIGGPFQYFADMVREGTGWIAGWLTAQASGRAIITYGLYTLLLCVLLLLGRKSSQLYIAGLCALASLVHHLLLCIRTGQIYPVSLAIAIGLALALFFLIIRAKSPALWLSDAYVISLSVWIFREGFLAPLVRFLSLADSPVANWLNLPATSMVDSLNGLWGIPLYVWVLIPLACSVLPIVLLSRGRTRG